MKFKTGFRPPRKHATQLPQLRLTPYTASKRKAPLRLFDSLVRLQTGAQRIFTEVRDFTQSIKANQNYSVLEQATTISSPIPTRACVTSPTSVWTLALTVPSTEFEPLRLGQTRDPR